MTAPLGLIGFTHNQFVGDALVGTYLLPFSRELELDLRGEVRVSRSSLEMVLDIVARQQPGGGKNNMETQNELLQSVPALQ